MKPVLHILLTLFFLANLSVSFAQSKPKPKPTTPTTTTTATTNLKIDYEKYTLSNGLDVILHKDASDPIVAVAIVFNVGSNREKVGRTGFAHFFEHMLFQSSENVGKGNFFKTIEDLGGEFNGGTWQDGTIYYEVVPKDALERILWMESDRMGFMINTVTTPVLENEKQVVKNEKRQRVDNVPYGHTNYVINKAIYPTEHPYNWQVIGSLEDLQAATIDDVKEFYNKWYGPGNATMVIAGDIDFAQTKAFVEKYFSEIPARPAVEPMKPQAGRITEVVKLMHEDNFAQLADLNMVWVTVEEGHPDSYALQYLGQILAQGKRAPLYKELVENKKLAPSPFAFQGSSELAGVFRVGVRANANVDLDSVYSSVFTAFKNFEQNGIDDKDMERIKAGLEKDFYNGISSVLSKSFQLAEANEFSGGPQALAEEIQKIQAVTKADVMRVYQKYIKDKPYVLTSFVPKGKVELAVEGSKVAEVVEEPIVQGAEAPPMEEKEGDFVRTPTKFDRTKIPALGAAPLVKDPVIWTATTKNGIGVYGIENNELPLVEFSLRIKGGMWLDDPKKVGVANLTAQVMQEGTKNKTPEELQDALGQLGANINISAGSEFITVTGSCLTRNYEKTMALLDEMLLEPRWDANEFERLKQRAINQIQQQSAQPASVTQRAFNKMIYGENNILSNVPIGTLASVQDITLEDLKNYYTKNFTPTLSAYHLTGAVSKDRTLKALTNLETKWLKKEVKLPALPAPTAPAKSQAYFVDIPDSKQSVIYIGAPAMKGGDPEFFAASVVNDRLGAGTSSRLFQKLREEKGYTYGAGSNFVRRINNGFFIATSSVRTNVTKESIELFKEIIDGYAKDFSQEDLDKTKSSLLRSNARAYETLGDKMGILMNISTYSLPLDYLKKQQQLVTDMTLPQAKQLITKFIDGGKLVYMITGDAKTQLERLQDLGLGKVIMLDRNGGVVKP